MPAVVETPPSSAERLSEEDVMVVGEADDLEFIPVDEVTVPAPAAEQATEAHDTPAILPTTRTTQPTPLFDTNAVQQKPVSPSRARIYAALAVAASVGVVLWTQSERISSSLEGPRATTAPPGAGVLSAKLMRFDVPDLVVLIPVEAPKPAPAAAPGPKRVGAPKDTSALAELEKLAAGLPSPGK